MIALIFFQHVLPFVFVLRSLAFADLFWGLLQTNSSGFVGGLAGGGEWTVLLNKVSLLVKNKLQNESSKTEIT